MISRPAKLKRDHFSLAIEQDNTTHVPFEDIAIIVLNHKEITLSHAVLDACGEYGISLFTTGKNHQPSGVFLPFLTHSRSTRWLRLQLDLPRPIIKQAWAAIIKQKIYNQATVLHMLGKEGTDRLNSYAQRVRSGDVGNLEGQAAYFYFTQLFGKDFKRSQTRFINAALDYGYAILRGAIARGLVAHGFHPSIGIFHSNEQNAFNLADDVIEPFRPLVDLFVYEHTHIEREELQPQDKAALVSILNIDVAMPQGNMSTLSAIEYMIESLARIYNGGSTNLIEQPNIIGLAQHRLEY